jgi:hypothetical protein
MTYFIVVFEPSISAGYFQHCNTKTNLLIPLTMLHTNYNTMSAIFTIMVMLVRLAAAGGGVTPP